MCTSALQPLFASLRAWSGSATSPHTRSSSPLRCKDYIQYMYHKDHNCCGLRILVFLHCLYSLVFTCQFYEMVVERNNCFCCTDHRVEEKQSNRVLCNDSRNGWCVRIGFCEDQTLHGWGSEQLGTIYY